MRRVSSGLAVALLMVAGAAHAQPATGGPPPRPRTSDAERVVTMMRDAYARRPDPRILLNLGLALHALRRDCEAVETLDQYLRDHAAYRAELTARARRHRAAALRRCSQRSARRR